jgi:uncharacterized membrane protein YsdA (DUF1294 family)
MNKFAWLMLLLIGAIFATIQPWLAGVYGLINLVTFSLYYRDKSAAKQGQWRIKESTLQFFSLIGGWPAALLGQYHLRHKTQKSSFKRILRCCILLNSVGVCLLCYQQWHPLLDAYR